MKQIISTLAQRPRIVDIIVGLTIVVGLLTVSSLRSNFLPPEPIAFVNVNVVYRGASPQEVEEEVINKIEDNLEGINGVLRVTSTSSERLGNVRVELTEDFDAIEALQEITNAVDKITTFPAGIDAPIIVKEEILNYTMTMGIIGSSSLSHLKDVAEHVKDELLQSPNLSKVFLSGFPDEEIEVAVRESDMSAYNVTFDDIARAIQSANLKASGGELTTDSRNILVRINEQAYYSGGLADIVVKSSPDGKKVRLAEVATIRDQFVDQPERAFVNGKPAVILKIFSTSQEDILQNAADLNTYVDNFNAGHQGIEAIVVEDKAISLSDAIGNLVNNAWQGILLVLIVLGLFLDPRIAWWVAFKIPVALLGMFIISSFYDLTINQVSLFGLIVVLGIIVDDGVVVAENIYEKFQQGYSPLRAAVEGTSEVFSAILTSLATTSLAFSLFFFLDGQLGDFFSDISFVVCATLFVALLESLFILPVHIARSKTLTAGYKPWKLTQWTIGSLLWFRDKVYRHIIRFFVKVPIAAVVLVVACMYVTIAALGSGMIKGTFFPTIDQDVITAKLELPVGTDESIVADQLALMEEQVWKTNEYFSTDRADSNQVINYVERVIGPNSNEGALNIYMLEGDKRGIMSYEIADHIRELVGPIQEARNLSYGSIAVFGKPVSVALISPDIEALRDAKSRLRQWLVARTDLKDVTDTDQQGQPELRLRLTSKATQLGLSEGVVFDQVRKGFFGLEAQSIQRGDDEVKIWIRYDDQNRRSITDIEESRLRLPNGASYPVGELVNIEQTTNVAAINHQDGVREIKVEADVANLLVSVPGVLAEAEQTVLAEIKQDYPSMRYTLEGEARLSAKTQNSSQGPSTIVFLLMIGLLLLNFRSVSKTLAVFFMLPFAFVGVAWGTYLHNIPVSIFSVLGMIALWGVLINNGLVLLSTYNEKLASGLTIKEALITSAISRFRPIILTTITTVFGLAPLLFNNSISAQFLKPTAIAISYGLIFGTILTLILLPSLMLMLAALKYWFAKFIRRQVNVKAEEQDIVMKEVANQIS